MHWKAWRARSSNSSQPFGSRARPFSRAEVPCLTRAVSCWGMMLVTRAKLVKKDNYVAAVEINSAFTLVREELFVYGLLSLVPATLFYFKKKREYDAADDELESMYKPWTKGARLCSSQALRFRSRASSAPPVA